MPQPNQKQQIRRSNYHLATQLSKGQLKKQTANAYSNYLQKRETNPNQAKLLKQRLIGLRHRLTQEVLGGSAGSGFNPGLSVKGQRKSTRQVLKAKLGDQFGAYYFTGDKKRGNGGNGGKQIGTVKPPKYTGPGTTGRRIGPPNQR